MTWDPDPTQRREPMTAPWVPGAPPIDADTLLGAGPVPPAPPPPGRRRGPLVLAVVLAVLVLAGLGTGVGLAVSGGDSGPAAAGSGTPVAGGSTASPATSAATTDAAPTPAPTTAASVIAAPAAQSYTAPGGLTVQGPAGWTADGAANNPNIRDFDTPGSPARLASATFRIGIGNPTPTGSFQDEVTAAANFQVTDKDATILATTYTSFLGTTAGDIVYSYYNADYGVQRQGVERIWRHDGVTLIIQSSDVAANWTAAAAVFDQLVGGAQVG